MILDDNNKPIPQVDGHKQPNCSEIYFLFDLKNHRLSFDSSRISPLSMRDFISDLCSYSDYSTTFDGSLKVSIENSQETVENILNMSQITDLNIYIYKPNPDEFTDSLEEQVQQRLNSTNSEEYREEYRTSQGSIIPDKPMKQMMHIAPSNGRIVAKGKDEHIRTKIEDTDKHPRVEKYSVKYKNINEYLSEFKDKSRYFIDKIMNELKNV